mmetsp:Transcript_10936/g.24144  ORF Transcript_10936/g.24144 Transcript_10936/m.24144 type:complete len:257 (+) Transcript_10936:171-941(+)
MEMVNREAMAMVDYNRGMATTTTTIMDIIKRVMEVIIMAMISGGEEIMAITRIKMMDIKEAISDSSSISSRGVRLGMKGVRCTISSRCSTRTMNKVRITARNREVIQAIIASVSSSSSSSSMLIHRLVVQVEVPLVAIARIMAILLDEGCRLNNDSQQQQEQLGSNQMGTIPVVFMRRKKIAMTTTVMTVMIVMRTTTEMVLVMHISGSRVEVAFKIMTSSTIACNQTTARKMAIILIMPNGNPSEKIVQQQQYQL